MNSSIKKIYIFFLKSFNRVSIKFLVPLIAILVVGFTAITIFVIQSQFNYARKQLLNHARITLTNISTDILNHFIEGNNDKIQTIFVNAKKANADILYIGLIDKNGATLAHTDVMLHDTYLDKNEFDKAAISIKKYTVRKIPSREAVEIARPVLSFGSQSDVLAIIRMAVNEEKIIHKTRETRNAIIIAGIIVCTVLSVFTIFIILTKVSKPLRNLNREMRAFGNDVTFKDITRSARKDEIGSLINMFANMANSISDYSSNLEQKVTERTEDLRKTMSELEETNKKLTETSNALWGEMQLAKKLQTVMLPEKYYLPGYDIDIHMEIADEVGGDYYDVINAENTSWIIIGDVSGHGVTAGLIMMMVQTSIRTVLINYPSLDPSVLLNMVNEVISDNITRLGEDKYMTITALAYHENHMFHFSGLHQDIKIFRFENKTVESIETDGIWLGFKRYNMFKKDINKSLKLYPGDVMMLYTDGITECFQKDGKMYSEKRLTDVMRENGLKPVNEIKQNLVDSLSACRKRDDLTFMLLKRLE
ncbi:MAG: SpoIIE family protein phosphatase [bacterium]|nr:SpoIIE family protein phosphatase [bacterium]